MVIHVHIHSSCFWEQSYSLSIVQVPMVSEHNELQPTSAGLREDDHLIPHSLNAAQQPLYRSPVILLGI